MIFHGSQSNIILVMIFHGSQSNIILWSVSNFLILVCGCFLGSPQPSLQVYNTKWIIVEQYDLLTLLASRSETTNDFLVSKFDYLGKGWSKTLARGESNWRPEIPTRCWRLGQSKVERTEVRTPRQIRERNREGRKIRMRCSGAKGLRLLLCFMVT